MIVNFVLFQIGWFASVLGAASGRPWLGVGMVVAVVAVHLAMKATPGELALVGTAALVGAVVDTVLLQSGLVIYRSPVPLTWLAPAWIVAMWANFAITLRHSLAWLGKSAALAALIGAVFGPLAYWAASKLGAAGLSPPVPALVVVGLAWGCALPALFGLSARYALPGSAQKP